MFHILKATCMTPLKYTNSNRQSSLSVMVEGERIIYALQPKAKNFVGYRHFYGITVFP